MLDLKEARSPAGKLARNDFEFVVSALRAGAPFMRPDAFEAKTKPDGSFQRNPATNGAMAAMTQTLWSASSPKGWPDDPAFWLSAPVMARRLRWIPRLVKMMNEPDPKDFARATLGPLASKNTLAVLNASSNKLQSLGLVFASPEFNRR